MTLHIFCFGPIYPWEKLSVAQKREDYQNWTFASLLALVYKIIIAFIREENITQLQNHFLPLSTFSFIYPPTFELFTPPHPLPLFSQHRTNLLKVKLLIPNHHYAHQDRTLLYAHSQSWKYLHEYIKEKSYISNPNFKPMNSAMHKYYPDTERSNLESTNLSHIIVQ